MKRKKRVMGLVLSFALIIMTTIGVQAANFSVKGTVIGDGVRLRLYPDYGTVLGLMYTGETVYIDQELSYAAYYVKRAKSGTIGYADFHYISIP